MWTRVHGRLVRKLNVTAPWFLNLPDAAVLLLCANVCGDECLVDGALDTILETLNEELGCEKTREDATVRTYTWLGWNHDVIDREFERLYTVFGAPISADALRKAGTVVSLIVTALRGTPLVSPCRIDRNGTSPHAQGRPWARQK